MVPFEAKHPPVQESQTAVAAAENGERAVKEEKKRVLPAQGFKRTSEMPAPTSCLHCVYRPRTHL